MTHTNGSDSLCHIDDVIESCGHYDNGTFWYVLTREAQGMLTESRSWDFGYTVEGVSCALYLKH